MRGLCIVSEKTISDNESIDIYRVFLTKLAKKPAQPRANAEHLAYTIITSQMFRWTRMDSFIHAANNCGRAINTQILGGQTIRTACPTGCPWYFLGLLTLKMNIQYKWSTEKVYAKNIFVFEVCNYTLNLKQDMQDVKIN